MKPYNILLDSVFNAKIADFDLANVYNRAHTHENTGWHSVSHLLFISPFLGSYVSLCAWTVSVFFCFCLSGYLAPGLSQHREFSTKSDIYRYGVVGDLNWLCYQ